MPDIFISYSRKDTDFVRTLHDNLVKNGLEVWVDWQDIPPTVDWWKTIGEGIEASNAFVLVISPNSLASPVCHLEINYAIAHNKRLIPIVRITSDEKEAFAKLISEQLDHHVQATLGERDLMSVARQNWQEVARHNWLFFIEDDTFDSRLKLLMDTLNTDYDYLQQHTQLLLRARNWEKRGYQRGFLLPDTELKEAQQWLNQAEKNKLEPSPAEIHKLFVKSSRDHRIRQRRLRTMVATLLPVSGLLIGSMAIWQITQSPPSPTKMDGKFNIAVAPVYEINNGNVSINDDTDVLTQMIYSEIRDGASTVDGFAEGDVQVILVNSDPIISEQDAEAVIEAYNAHIVIYGILDAGEKTFTPVYYYDSNLTGVSEITGEGAFGAPLENFPLNINTDLTSITLLTETEGDNFGNRIRILSQFLYGIAAFQSDLYPITLKHFNFVLDNKYWEDSEGKKILYLWIGTLFDRSFANHNPEGGLECPEALQPENPTVPALDCAKAAYEQAIKAAEAENANRPFARAYLGLGNVYHSFATALPIAICEYYTDLAIPTFEDALQIDQETELAPSLTSVKAHFNLGASYFAYNECISADDTDVLQSAADNFNAATVIAESLETTNEIRALTAEAYLRLGVVYVMLQDIEQALAAYDQAIAVTNPPETDLAREPDWKDIRYLASVRKASVYRQIAVIEDAPEYWDKLIHETNPVLDAYFETKAFTDKASMVSVLYFRGLAYEAMSRVENACDSYNKALEVGQDVPNTANLDAVQDRLTALGSCD